ncbi:MAG: di-heme oxidoredictase family protein [Planctomycetota bacterium]
MSRQSSERTSAAFRRRFLGLASTAFLASAGVLTSCSESSSTVSGGEIAPDALGDEPTIASHVLQADVEADRIDVETLIERGKQLFVANFNTLDGAGRPETTGTGAVRARRESPENFNRISGPDANSCAGCHNKPFAGGGGDNVANVFVLGQAHSFVTFDGGAGDDFGVFELDTVANERATIGMAGSGYIEMLAREMTADLQAIRQQVIDATLLSGNPETLPLVTKGIDFGQISADVNQLPGDILDTSGIVGVDTDLVVKPFHQKGVVISLREFTNNAMNHHHGMQSTERFGEGVDHDKDGHVDELSVGDVTATTIFQATLPAPGRVLPNNATALASVANGETIFSNIGCADCHTPFLTLEDPVFSEPNPYNPAGNLRVQDVAVPLEFDLTATGPGPHLSKEIDGTVKVRAYTDLKRHDMGSTFAEPLVQAGVPGNVFLTKKLWGMANESPYMHNGRATTITEAIQMHGGEGQASNDAFALLSASDQDDLVAFLKTLQTLPEDAASNTILETWSGVVGEEPAVPAHVSQTDVDNGLWSADALFQIGSGLFNAHFNTLDGAGRPDATGTGAPRPTETMPHNFNRISAPDSGACGACHNSPRSGGGGDNVANVFVLAQAQAFVNFDDATEDPGLTLQNVANERNTLGMFGSGYIELLAREMTAELQAIRDSAISQANTNAATVTLPLVTKGVDFGSISADPGDTIGTVDTSAVAGVDADLIVKPFHQKGVVISLREFTNNAMNHHHGMQSTERFGVGVDHDGDGMVDELDAGDITAVTLYQAMLPAPGRIVPADAARRKSVDRGEQLFMDAGCADCHVPFLVLDSPIFTEPNPYNPAGNLQVADVPMPFAVDLCAQGPGPRLPRETGGEVLVPAFTDLKRHDMGPDLAEPKVQAGVPGNMFLTKKLWGMANEPPFMHDGRSLTIDDAVRRHGGEGAASRDAYLALTEDQRKSIVDYLKCLQVVPENAPLEIVK